MNAHELPMSSGLSGLDRILQGVMPGDNIVFQVDSMEDYLPFVASFCDRAVAESRSLVYFRFADHPPLPGASGRAETYEIAPESGFENFISDIFDVIEAKGKEAYYVFDCLSDLAADWYSDRMLANFFMLTCPYLYDFDTVTLFALLRNHHTPLAVKSIHTTAQVILDVYGNRGRTFIHPLKVQGRFSPTIHMLHQRSGEDFSPVTKSNVIAEVMADASQPWLDFTVARQDLWTRTFSQAQGLLARQSDCACAGDEEALFKRMLRMAISREGRILELAERSFTLRDIVDIGKRMIGTGLIGGKSAGMLLARAILRRSDPKWEEILEPHDSFFIGSDVFYSYILRNKCWWLRRKQKKSGLDDEEAEEVGRRILSGDFPPEIQAQFIEMLDYFGQSPIIVRSSSLLEDAYGNAFSGKYESVFCANQGDPQKRLEDFLDAVRKVYASTMNPDALDYRSYFGLMDSDEQMALLVQRVSGENYGGFYFPQVAGVGFSFNPFVWSEGIDPEAGMLRLVFGLGTRAVDRSDDDYTRIVALNAPKRRPDAHSDDRRKFSQKRVDLLDLGEGVHASKRFEEVAKKAAKAPLHIFAGVDGESMDRGRELDLRDAFHYVLTFDELLDPRRPFVSLMKEILQTLQKAYKYPVDMEFAANFLDEERFQINLLQCRPFQVKGTLKSIQAPEAIPPKSVLFKTTGPIIGNSVSTKVDRLIYVAPSTYSKLGISERYKVARLIGRICSSSGGPSAGRGFILMVGPGRWGTTMPSLGVPVSFSEISGASAICEVARMNEGLVPDVSLGTHFFNDLVEMDMLYAAVYPEREDSVFNEVLLESLPSRLSSLDGDSEAFLDVVRVIDSDEGLDGLKILLSADGLKQRAVCWIEKAKIGSA